MLTTILIGFTILLCLYFYWSRKQKQMIFKNLGISGPEPSFLFGNLSELHSKGELETANGWAKKYGNVLGYFEGTSPVLLVADPNIVKNILVQNFHKFHSRKTRIIERPQNTPYMDVGIARADKWKNLRTLGAPSFTAKRMKEMSPIINQSVDVLLDIFKKQSELKRDFDIHKVLARFTLDVISSCAFGIDTHCLSNPDSEFLKQSEMVFNQFRDPPSMKILQKIIVLFPEVINFLRKYVYADLMCLNFKWHWEFAKKVIQQRQREPIDRVDFMQLMFEANKNAQTTGKGEPLTLEEMQAQCALFLLAGSESTGTALAFTCYELALHPEIQEKLRKEIDEHFPDKNCRPDYNSIQNLKYMHMVFNEVLRKHPTGDLIVRRLCFEEHQIGDLKIPKGMNILFNMGALHHNPELWPKHDPSLFVPERFEDGEKEAYDACIWLPFGSGPRNCAGIKFAIVNYKIALTRILKNFTIVRSSNTKVPCPVKVSGLRAPSEGVTLLLEQR